MEEHKPHAKELHFALAKRNWNPLLSDDSKSTGLVSPAPTTHCARHKDGCVSPFCAILLFRGRWAGSHPVAAQFSSWLLIGFLHPSQAVTVGWCLGVPLPPCWQPKLVHRRVAGTEIMWPQPGVMFEHQGNRQHLL